MLRLSQLVKHILDRVKQDLTLEDAYLILPGGIVLVGGTAIMPGVVEVVSRDFGDKC